MFLWIWLNDDEMEISANKEFFPYPDLNRRTTNFVGKKGEQKDFVRFKHVENGMDFQDGRGKGRRRKKVHCNCNA